MIRIFKRCSEIINFESSAKLVKEAGFYRAFRIKSKVKKENGRYFA